MGGAEMAPHTPPPSARPGEAVAGLYLSGARPSPPSARPGLSGARAFPPSARLGEAVAGLGL